MKLWTEPWHWLTRFVILSFCQIDPILMGAYDRILQIAKEYGLRLLQDRLSNDDAQKLLEKIIKDYPNHSFVIDTSELDSLELLPHEESNAEVTIILEELYQKLHELEEHLIIYVDASSEETAPVEQENKGVGEG